MTKKLVNSAPIAFIFAGVVFGSVTYYAYQTAISLHTTGSELIKYFL